MRYSQIDDVVKQFYPNANWVEVDSLVTHRGDTLVEGKIYFENGVKEFSIKFNLTLKEEE